MKILESLLLLYLTQWVVVSSIDCTSADFDLSDDLALDGKTVKLQKKVHNVKLTIKKVVDCTFVVTAFKDMQMKMTVTTYSLKDDDLCNTAYLKAGKTDAVADLKVCTAKKAGSSVTSTSKEIYLAVKSQEQSGSVELMFESIQGAECGPSEIVLTKPNETITFPMNSATFTENSECDIVVKGLKNRAFTMTIPEISLFDGVCTQDYIAASVVKFTDAEPKNKMCKPADAEEPIFVTNGILYLKIVTASGQASAGVTLNFETEYPECGASNIVLSEEVKEISLPPSGQSFKSDTICNIKASSKAGNNFTLTIPEINLADGDCKYDYVSASTTMTNLPNDTYKHCGNSPVVEPFESAKGVMYLQIKTKSATADTMVKLKFESGAGKPGQYAITFILLINMLSITHL